MADEVNLVGDTANTVDTTQLDKDYPIFKFFNYSHLPENLQEFSRPFAYLALDMIQKLPRSAEVTAGLRKLLEAKDCFVRARL